MWYLCLGWKARNVSDEVIPVTHSFTVLNDEVAIAGMERLKYLTPKILLVTSDIQECQLGQIVADRVLMELAHHAADFGGL